MNYDRTVEYAMEMRRKNGWHLIQDTTLEGYEKVPTWIIQGYLTMANEAREQLESLNEKPTHIFLQAGVGAMAGGILGYFANFYSQNKPLVTVTLLCADCHYGSLSSGSSCLIQKSRCCSVGRMFWAISTITMMW